MDCPHQLLSTNTEGLPQEAKERYMKKISAIDNTDPFLNGSKIGKATDLKKFHQ